MRVREALEVFLRKHGLDGSHLDRRLIVRLGPIHLPFPNPGFLPVHDLHHLALDAPPTFWGEVELSAFEMRSGTPTALITFLCIGALVLGFLRSPRRVIRSWKRYAGSRNLYADTNHDAMLELDVEALRAHLRVPQNRSEDPM